MERNGKGDGNKKKVRYVMKRNNRKEIECRVKFQEKENVAAIQGKLDFRWNSKIGMENKKGLYECQYNPTGFDRRSTKQTYMPFHFEVLMENGKFSFNQFFPQPAEQYYEKLI